MVDMSKLVHIGMASLPRRARAAKKAIQSILNQEYTNWHLWVSLNTYKRIPSDFPVDRRITYRLSDNSLGDAEKFYPLNQEGSNLLFTVDDDIYYPKNYLSTMLHQWNAANGSCAIAVHGSILSARFKDWFYDRWVSHFAAKQKHIVQVHVLGTGTTLLNKEWLEGYKAEEWRNISDIGISLYLRREGVARITIPRPKHWLKPIGGVEAVCYSKSNTTRITEKLRPHLQNLRQDVKCPIAPIPMREAVKSLPRKKRPQSAPRVLQQKEPQPIKSRSKSRARAIPKQEITKLPPRWKRH